MKSGQHEANGQFRIVTFVVTQHISNLTNMMYIRTNECPSATFRPILKKKMHTTMPTVKDTALSNEAMDNVEYPIWVNFALKWLKQMVIPHKLAVGGTLHSINCGCFDCHRQQKNFFFQFEEQEKQPINTIITKSF